MQYPIDIDVIISKIAGAVGAGLSLRHVKGSAVEKTLYFTGGMASAYYGAPYAIELFHLPDGLTSFLLGNFGMSVLARLREFLDTTSVSDILTKVLGR